MNACRYCILILCLLFIPTKGMVQANNIKLRLKWWHQFQFAGYYAAVTQGYYKEAGLNVAMVPGDATHPVINEVLSGNADFGISGSDLLIEYGKGKPVVALGAVFQHSPYVIMSLPGKRIQAPSDLVGKTIMADENQGWVELRAMFLKEGIDVKKFSVVLHTWNNSDLLNGKADAMTGYRSVEPYQLEKAGVQPSFIMPIDYGVDFYGDVLFTKQSFLRQNPETVEKFREASFRGWEYAMSHKEELCNYILRLPGVSERKLTKEALLYEANEMEKLILPQLVEPGHMNEGRWNHILSLHQRLGIIPAKTSLDGFIYTKKPSLFDSLKNIGAVVLGSVALLFFIIILYGFMVRKAVKRKTSEQRLALEALRSSEERYRTLVEQASDGIVISDPGFRFISANSAALQLFGYTSEEFYRMRLSDIMVMRPGEADLRTEELFKGESLLTERLGKRKDGSTFVAEIHSNMLPNGNYLGFVRDITEKKNAQDQLLKHERQLDLIYNKVADCIFVLSVGDNNQYRFISINTSFLDITGLRASDVLNKNVEDVIPQPSLPFVLEKYREAIDQKRTVQWEEETVYPTGKKNGIVSVTPVFENEVCVQLIGSVHDITDTKNANDELIRRAIEREVLIQELSATNRELKQFSFITSHNLRAPLTNLVALTELIDTSKINDKETLELLAGFKTSTQQLNNTINDLARILIIKENPNMPMDLVYFAEIYKQVANSIHSIIEGAETIIHTDFSGAEKISYNRVYMESIFLNLLTNAIKYAQPGRKPEIYIHTLMKDGHTELVFRDNGSGLDMEKVKDRLFGLHQRFHNHPDSKGIGLYLVHSQVTSLGGTIQAESELGKGTTFTIKFR